MTPPRFVNLDLMGNPLNWVTLAIWLMLLGFLIHSFSPYLMSAYGNQSQTKG